MSIIYLHPMSNFQASNYAKKWKYYLILCIYKIHNHHNFYHKMLLNIMHNVWCGEKHAYQIHIRFISEWGLKLIWVLFSCLRICGTYLVCATWKEKIWSDSSVCSFLVILKILTRLFRCVWLRFELNF